MKVGGLTSDSKWGGGGGAENTSSSVTLYNFQKSGGGGGAPRALGISSHARSFIICFKQTVTYMLTVLGLQITTERISAAQTFKSKQFCFKDQNYGIHFHHLSLVGVL